MKPLPAILLKEFAEIGKNKLLLFTIVGPLLLLPILPLAMVYTVNLNLEPVTVEDVRTFVARVPAWANLPPRDVLLMVMLQQMMILFWIMPLAIPMSVAAFSIIGEKKARTLEPLLATPVPTSTILLGKSIAAVLPGLCATWLAYLLTLVGLRLLLTSEVVWQAISGPVWWVAMGAVTPLLALFSVLVGVIVSSRVNDTRVAQQIGGVVVLPVVAFSVAQVAGFLLLNMTTILLGGLIVLALDGLTLWVAVVLFERERILTRWT
ncbi:MAG: ABC transporter permease [Caldilineae bacterium]|nr:MAG: ABC transporter permease [Caldilineae bacterium]